MTPLEIARRLAELGEADEACKAYTLALDGTLSPEEAFEASVFLLEHGEDYKIPYTSLVQLFNDGHLQERVLPLLVGAFYEPNERGLRSRYERNCRLLSKYPYLFRKDFLPFGDLPLCFFPFDDDHGYVPYDTRESRFLPFVNVRDTIVSRNFFADLEKPVLASDVFSQYELEYLRDNVRPSEYLGRENHVYLHYTSWEQFCAWLQVLSVGPLLEGKKLVFLIGDEIEQYPIDFKARFGIDYSQYPLRPVGVREIQRLIWHTQLSAHNGGDFFNEVFDQHPNLLNLSSRMFDSIESAVEEVRENMDAAADMESAVNTFGAWPRHVVEELFQLRSRTEKDMLCAIFLGQKEWNTGLDPASRIAPAIFFQPHFPNMEYALRIDERGNTMLECARAEAIHASPLFTGFKYIKTFTPLRRFTTSYGGTVRFMLNEAETQWREEPDAETQLIINDAVTDRVLNRSFMRDSEDRLYRDSIVVRFEDGKLNPKATFTRLAAFLDLPYTESMTYCSEQGVLNRTAEGNVVGFDPASVYKTYDDYCTDDERAFIEYFLRDAYEFYGYDFHYYDGAPADLERVKGWIAGFTTIDALMRRGMDRACRAGISVSVSRVDGQESTEEELKAAKEKAKDAVARQYVDAVMAQCAEVRLKNVEIMLRGLRFVNRRGQPLRLTPVLEPDPALLVQPLYR